MPGYSYEFLTTVGLEMEGEGINRGTLQDYIVEQLSTYYPKNIPVQVTRDASAESVVQYLRISGNDRHYGIPVNTHNKVFKRLIRGSGNTSNFGYELVFNPMRISQLKPLVYRLESVLQTCGDFVTDRSATHFHVGFAHNLKLMKRLLRLCLSIDSLLYRLGGMGGTFRGHTNLAAYARPLMNSSAVPIASSRIRLSEDDDSPSIAGYAQIINPLQALEARNLEDFWACFGVFASTGNIVKYHPARYTGCNLYAILAHGTMEFRHFNQSGDAQLIFTLAKFLRACVEVSTEMSKDDFVRLPATDSNKEIDDETAARLLWGLESLFREKDIEDAPTSQEMVYLMSIVEKSHFIPIPETPVQTHVRDFRLSSGNTLNLKPVANPLKPKHIDIHTLESLNNSILGGNF